MNRMRVTSAYEMIVNDEKGKIWETKMLEKWETF